MIDPIISVAFYGSILLFFLSPASQSRLSLDIPSYSPIKSPYSKTMCTVYSKAGLSQDRQNTQLTGNQVVSLNISSYKMD